VGAGPRCHRAGRVYAVPAFLIHVCRGRGAFVFSPGSEGRESGDRQQPQCHAEQREPGQCHAPYALIRCASAAAESAGVQDATDQERGERRVQTGDRQGHRAGVSRVVGRCAGSGGPLIVCVADRLKPLHDLVVERFVHRDVGHGRIRRGAVPVLLPRRDPDHVAGLDGFDRAARAPHSAAAVRDDEGLAQRVGVPGRAGPADNRDRLDARRSPTDRLPCTSPVFGLKE